MGFEKPKCLREHCFMLLLVVLLLSVVPFVRLIAWVPLVIILVMVRKLPNKTPLYMFIGTTFFQALFSFVTILDVSGILGIAFLLIAKVFSAIGLWCIPKEERDGIPSHAGLNWSIFFTLVNLICITSCLCLAPLVFIIGVGCALTGIGVGQAGGFFLVGLGLIIVPMYTIPCIICCSIIPFFLFPGTPFDLSINREERYERIVTI